MSTLTEKIRQAVAEMRDRRYGVKGEIVFVFKPPLENPDLDALRSSIKEVDKLFPWKEDDVPDGAEKPPSIFYLGDGQVVVQNFHPTEQHIWFSVHPRYDSMRRGQIYAYEKYLAKLAEELAKPKPHGYWPASVRSVITIKASTSFKLIPIKADLADKSTSLGWQFK